MLAMPPERIRIVYKAIKPSGLGKGSHSGLQRLVGAISNIQTNDWELDRGCHVLDRQKYSVLFSGWRVLLDHVLAMTHPFPPPPCHARAGELRNFSPTFP